MKSLQAIVTGGATNIGRSITEALLARGARVAVGQLDPRVARWLVAAYGARMIALREVTLRAVRELFQPLTAKE